MNSPIKYFGGKNGMFNKIVELFPESGTYDTYIEPFGGSFAIGFHTPEDRIAPIILSLNINLQTPKKTAQRTTEIMNLTENDISFILHNINARIFSF